MLEQELKLAQDETTNIGMLNNKLLKGGNQLSKTQYLDRQRMELDQTKRLNIELSKEMVQVK
jgi:hypothetical protein